MPARINFIGMRFDRLLVVADIDSGHGKRRLVKCLCDCGRTKEFRAQSVRRHRSCGCRHREITSELCRKKNTTHNMRHSVEYDIWCAMKGRCHNPSNTSFSRYGALGIVVCEKWRTDFSAFLADMGARPSADHSIDRIDGSLGYEPGNCRWATITEQARNRSNNRLVFYEGRELPLSEACELAGVNYQTAQSRLKKNRPWNVSWNAAANSTDDGGQ